MGVHTERQLYSPEKVEEAVARSTALFYNQLVKSFEGSVTRAFIAQVMMDTLNTHGPDLWEIDP